MHLLIVSIETCVTPIRRRRNFIIILNISLSSVTFNQNSQQAYVSMALHPRKFFRTSGMESPFAVNLNVTIHCSQQFRFYGGPFHHDVDGVARSCRLVQIHWKIPTQTYSVLKHYGKVNCSPIYNT